MQVEMVYQESLLLTAAPFELTINAALPENC